MKLPQLKIPRVHKIPVQQGNVITQDMVDRLKPGMSRSQVAYVMGEPVLRNTFDDNRWDYVYSLDIPNVLQQVVRMNLYFEGDSLAYFTGDMAPSSAVEEDSVEGTLEDVIEEAVESAAEDVVPPASTVEDDTASHTQATTPLAASRDS